MSTDADAPEYESDPITDQEKEFSFLEPQQQAVLTHGFAQAMLMAGYDKRKGTFASSVPDAIAAGVHLGSHVFDPQTINLYFEAYCRQEGRNNPYRDAVRLKTLKALEEQN